jgi:hypothetical protein
MRTLLATLGALLILASAHAAQDPDKDAKKEAVKVSDKALKQALKDKKPSSVDTAVKELLFANSLDSMKILLAAATTSPKPEKEPLPGEDAWWHESYFTILNAAASFTDTTALGELADFIVKTKARAIARDALSCVSNHGQKELIAVCLKVLDLGTEDLKIMAIDHLIAIADKTAIEPLVKAIKANEKSTGDLRRKIGRCLTILTGQNYGDSYSNWEGWWNNNKDKNLEVKEGERGASTGTAADNLDRGRHTEVEQLKKMGKLLVLGAGEKCKCGKNHDLDHIDQVTSKMGFQTDTITKDDLDKKDDVKLGDYIAILANCTHIREHCACPLCKPGNYNGDRLFQ